MKLFPAVNVFLATAVGVYWLYDRFLVPHPNSSGYHPGAVHVAARGVGIAVSSFWITAAATVVVGYLLVIAVALTAATVLLDLLLLPTSQRLTVTASMWHLVWNQVALGGYWSHRNEAGVVAGILILLAIAFVAKETT